MKPGIPADRTLGSLIAPNALVLLPYGFLWD